MLVNDSTDASMSNQYIDKGTGEVVQLGLVDMTSEAYHAAPGISKSHLDQIAGQSNMHYWARYVDPNREPTKETPAKVLGSAMHSIVLEPDLFKARYVANPGIDRRSNAGKAEYAAFVAENKGKVILDDEGFQTCLAVRDTVYRHPVAKGLLMGGKAEQAFFAIDPETGELIKCRYDYLHDSGALAVDLKSCEDASPDGFGKSAANYRYPMQPPWYFDVNDALYGEHPEQWVFIALEKAPPYAIGIYFMTKEDMGRGREACRRDLHRIIAAKRDNDWSDYGAEVLPLTLPSWARL